MSSALPSTTEGAERAQPSADQAVHRHYELRGLSRPLYREPPNWPEGTFVQLDEDRGELQLVSAPVYTPEAATAAIAKLDQVAERFRVAISRKVNRPVTMFVAYAAQPDFDAVGHVRVQSRLRITDSAEGTIIPARAPAAIEQLPQGAARWILTLTQAQAFDAFPDEVLKRLYLLIEEFEPLHAGVLDPLERDHVLHLRWMRHFVSHPVCHSPAVVAYVQSLLPSAVVQAAPLGVQFDRTDPEHCAFVARHEGAARHVANKLLDAAIARL